jgi:hypothetical protein
VKFFDSEKMQLDLVRSVNCEFGKLAGDRIHILFCHFSVEAVAFPLPGSISPVQQRGETTQLGGRLAHPLWAARAHALLPSPSQ